MFYLIMYTIEGPLTAYTVNQRLWETREGVEWLVSTPPINDKRRNGNSKGVKITGSVILHKENPPVTKVG